MTNGPTIWQQAASQFIPLSISQAALDATGFEDDEIWIAVFGEEIPIPGPGVVPPPAQAYYLDATSLSHTIPVLTTTQTLVPSSSTPNLPIVPSSTIEAWKNTSKDWGSNLAFPVPSPGNQWTGRIVISAGARVQAQVNQDTYHSVSAPSASDPTDPSTGTFYDFLEFTVTNSTAGVVSLDMDTSQVDSFGMPIGLQFYQDAAGTLPFNFTVNGSTNGNSQITGVTNLNQLVLQGLGAGQPITGPLGSGIPAGTLITGYDISMQTIYLNQSASTSQSVTLTAYAGGEVGVEAARDAIVSGATDDALFQFLQNQITAGNSQAQAFLQTAAPFRTAGAQPITGASDGNPIEISTYNASQLANNDWVYISGVGGNTAANGYFQIGGVSSTTFTPNGSTGNGTYTTGGTWSMAITGSTTLLSGEIQINASNTLGLQDGDLVEITGVTGNTGANGTWFVSDVSSTNFTLVGSVGTGDFSQNAGTWSVYAPGNRLVSPKDIVEGLASPQDPSALNNYYNEVIDAFFVNYAKTDVPVGNSGTPGNQTFNLVSTAYNNTALIYSGQVELDSTYGAYALTLKETTNTDPTTYRLYYPFLSTNTPSTYTPQLPVATTTPPWIISQSWQNQSASQMIFACDAVFADNVARKSYDMSANKAVSVLGDLEDSVSAAFNRGIVLNDPSTWDQTATWFQQNATQATTYNIQPGTYNYWVEYWHQTGLTYNNLAYAFPYDDKFGASTNLDLADVGLAKITLGAWTDTPGVSQTTTAFQNFPTSAGPTGSLTLTTQVAGSTPTGTVSFFINGIPINSTDNSSTPPVEQVAVSGGAATITAQMPQLPSGTGAATYTVTAVYSGDANHLPSIAHALLPIVEQVNVTLTDTSGVLGSTAEITSVTPGTAFVGTLTYTISKSDGTGVQTLASNVATSTQNNVKSYPIPTDLLTFTGTADGTNMISSVSSTTDLLANQVVSGTGVPTGTTITNVSGSTITLSNVVAAGTGITFTSNGKGASLPITVAFTPSTSMTPTASGSTDFTVTSDPYSFTMLPGSGALGATPTLIVTLPGPPYDGTIDFQISRPDATELQSLGTVNVSGSTLSGGNQVVVNNLAIPNTLLTFTAYADGTNSLQGISTVSGIVPTQQSISGGGVTANTITGFAPPALTLTNPAAETSTEPVTFSVNGVTITGTTTMGLQAVKVTSVSGWTQSTTLNGESITDNDSNFYVGVGNSVQNFTAGTMTLQNVVPTSNGSPVTFTSTANAMAYPITAVWTPTGGSALTSAPQMFGVT